MRNSERLSPPQSLEPSVEDKSEAQDRPKHLLGAFAIITATTLAATIGVNPFVEAKLTGDPLFSVKETFGKAFEHGSRVDMSGPTMEQVDSLLKPLGNEYYPDPGKRNYGIIETGPYMETGQYYEYCLEQAKSCGFEMVDVRLYTEKIRDASTVTEVEDIMRTFFARYNIDFSIPTQSQSAPYCRIVKPLDKGNVTLFGFQQHSAQFIARFSIKPVELVEYSGMKSIQLIEGFDDELSPDLSGDYSDPDVHSGIDYISFANLMEHHSDNSWLPDGQLAEFIDARINGEFGVNQDKAFYEVAGYTTTTERNWAIGEKREFYEENLSGIDNYSRVFSPIPIEKTRSRFLLARLEQDLPGVTRYLTAISPRNPNIPDDQP